LEIGGSVDEGGAFAGLIDDVRIYNTALTAAQIQGDMTTPLVSARPASEVTAAATTVVSGLASVTDAVAPAAARTASDGAVAPLRLMTWNVNGGHNRSG